MFKKIVSIIALTLFCFSAASIAQQPQYHHHILNFSKGLVTHVNLWNLDPGQASIARDVRFNKKYSSVSKRTTMISGGTIGAYAGTSIHRYYKSDGVAKLLVTGSDDIRLRTAGALTYTTIKDGLNSGKRWTWVTYKDKAIGTNGYDRAIKYDGSTSITAATDGHRTAENLCADLGAPFAELDTGTALTAGKWYQYKMMFYDGSTTSYSNARSNAIQVGPSVVQDIYLTDIPLGPTGTTHRYIYRTLGATNKAAVVAVDVAFYLVYTFTDDNSTQVYADDMTDATAVNETAWDTTSKSDATPPNCKYFLIHNNRVFAGGDTTAKEQSYIYWSDEYNPDYFPLAYYYQIRPDDGDEVTFIREENNILAIGKTNTIQNFYTTAASPSDWYPSNPFTFDGCPAPYSVANTPKGIFYVGHKGLYRFGGQMSQLVSDAVTPEIVDILETAMDDVVGFFWKNEYHLSFTSTLSGGTINNRVLVYDIIRDAYTLDYKNINAFCAFSSGTDYGILYSVSSDTDGLTYAHEGAPATLIKRYKSEIDAGTLDDTATTGTESEPVLDIGWDITIDEAIGTIDGHAYGATAIIDRNATSGTWESEVYQVNASSFDKLYWNESLGATGDIIVEMQTCDDSACSGESYGADYSDPSGSDISLESANDYVQFKVSFSTTDINYSPYLYIADGFMLKMIYGKEGSTEESSFLSIWAGGYDSLGAPGREKQIHKIKTYFKGDEGTVTVNFKNEDGIDTDFTIDMTITPPFTEEATDNKYTAVSGGEDKIYTYYTVGNEEGLIPIGEWFQFEVSSTGTAPWDVDRLVISFSMVEPTD